LHSRRWHGEDRRTGRGKLLGQRSGTRRGTRDDDALPIERT